MSLRKRIFAAAGYNTTYFGPGRKEFRPGKPMPSFESYLEETAKGTCSQLSSTDFDEGVIGNFMAPRFLKQGNLPGFLPFMVPSLSGKPCTAVEGACGSGGRAVYTAMKTILSDLADTVFVAGFEVQNTMKAIYGADVLAGAAYYHGERKSGCAYFFPGIFADRAGAYFEHFDKDLARRAMASWYEQSIVNARKNPKAQEYHNTTEDLIAQGMTAPDPKRFVPNLNLFDCSKVSDGASSIVIASEEGLKRLGIDKDNAIELISAGAAQGDITQSPQDLTRLDTTAVAVTNALEQAKLTINDIGLFELHDCFSITALLALEACGLASPGQAGKLVLDGETRTGGTIPCNPSGGLGGFGHPTGASGVRQLVDLEHQLNGRAENPTSQDKSIGLMISMGGNDKTVTAIIAKK